MFFKTLRVAVILLLLWATVYMYKRDDDRDKINGVQTSKHLNGDDKNKRGGENEHNEDTYVSEDDEENDPEGDEEIKQLSWRDRLNLLW